MPNWIYEKSTNRYRVTKEGAADLGLRPGTFVGQKQRAELRDKWTESQKKITDKLAIGYDNGSVKLSDWVLSMRQEIKTSYIEQYLLGKGGRNNMTQADWGRVGNAIMQQNKYLQGFARDLMNKQPPLSLAQIQARSRQYIDSSTKMYERANVVTRGMPDLPEYPADGKQNCHSNCKCRWDIKEFDDRWECTWILDMEAEHCESCLENASKWNPLVIKK